MYFFILTDLLDVHLKLDESSKDGDDETESAANNVLQAAAAFCRLHGFE